MHKYIVLGVCFLFSQSTLFSQKNRIISPNGNIEVSWEALQIQGTQNWILKSSHLMEGKTTEVFPKIELGLIRSDQSFVNLKLLGTTAQKKVMVDYTMPHGKRSHRKNEANEIILQFQNEQKTPMNVIVRAYNDGLAFRYEFPTLTKDTVRILEEITSYNTSGSKRRFLQKWNPANEAIYVGSAPGMVEKGEWGLPALINSADSAVWYLIHEADLDGTYCGTKLNNTLDSNAYKLTFPNPKDGRGMGEVSPAITGPWVSPWRLVIIGNLKTIVESTLVDDVSRPSKIKNTAWIKPGLVSWNYWSSNHGTMDYQIVKKFADLAAEFGWRYTLLDWEWDRMTNGGDVASAAKYIQSIGVKPLIWYNSGGEHTWVSSTPKDRMLTHENRMEEFAKLRAMGYAGVKVDFFESEKQDMIQYYLDIVEDAAQFEMLVYFHGCLVPRGWARTYPNLMTYEAVKGAEWYNNRPDFTTEAPGHNATLPYTRNVIGSMDYTPTTFTNSQYAHTTSFAHELALSVLFESALQHLADRPEGYAALPYAAKQFLSQIPAAWDDTKFVQGTPGRDAVIARRSGDKWFVGGVQSTWRDGQVNLPLDFLDENTNYKATIISDGSYDETFEINYKIVKKGDKVNFRILRRGGFAISIFPITD